MDDRFAFAHFRPATSGENGWQAPTGPLAAMEAFVGGPCGRRLIGQPNVALAGSITRSSSGRPQLSRYGSLWKQCHGLDDYPKESWPTTSTALLSFTHDHIGTIFIILMAYAGIQNLRADWNPRGCLVADARVPVLPRHHLGWMRRVGNANLAGLRPLSTSDGASKVVSSGTRVTSSASSALFGARVCCFWVWSSQISRGPVNPYRPD